MSSRAWDQACDEKFIRDVFKTVRDVQGDLGVDETPGLEPPSDEFAKEFGYRVIELMEMTYGIADQIASYEETE